MLKVLLCLVFILNVVSTTTPFLTTKQSSVTNCLNAEIRLLTALEYLNTEAQNYNAQAFTEKFEMVSRAIGDVKLLCKMTVPSLKMDLNLGDTCQDSYAVMRKAVREVFQNKNTQEIISSLVYLSGYSSQLRKRCPSSLSGFNGGISIGIGNTHYNSNSKCDFNSGKLLMIISNLFVGVKGKNTKTLSSSLYDLEAWVQNLMRSCVGTEVKQNQVMAARIPQGKNCDQDLEVLVDIVNHVMANPNDQGIFEFSVLQLIMMTKQMARDCILEQTFGIRLYQVGRVEDSDYSYQFDSDSDQY